MAAKDEVSTTRLAPASRAALSTRSAPSRAGPISSFSSFGTVLGKGEATWSTYSQPAAASGQPASALRPARNSFRRLPTSPAPPCRNMARTSLSRLRSRTVACVSWPAAESWIRQWAPTNPVPPVTKTRAIHSSPIFPSDTSANARLVDILRPVIRAALSKSFPTGRDMLHLEPRFKVKGGIFHAHRGALQKDGDLDLAHSFLREARGASQADPG